MQLTAIALIALFVGIASCASPEAARKRGDAGADASNRGKVVRLHEGARPFENTPKKIPVQHPPLDAANQADQLSRQ